MFFLGRWDISSPAHADMSTTGAGLLKRPKVGMSDGWNGMEKSQISMDWFLRENLQETMFFYHQI
jgi:hypothetical protein